MGNRAARRANAVSLFPFLAVLICAMGALILLLLVTTRRIRQQQLQSTVAAAVKEETPAPEQSSAAIGGLTSPARQEPHVEVQSETLSPPPPEPDPRDLPIEPLFAVDPPPPLPDPNDAWRERLQALEAQHNRLVAAVAEHQSTVAQIRTTANARSRAVGDLEKLAADADQQMRDIERSLQKLQQEQSDSHREAALIRRQIDESRERLADSSSKFTIMPFDGRRGTTKRPIVIECTERGITFVSEGVTLTPADLEGFNPRYNPLLYATKALANYWDRTDRRQAVQQGTTGHASDPYVLLVVRPRGTVAFYRARWFLGRMNESFGYELVREDQEFVWPESDPTAAELCRSIVEQMLSERESLMATVPGALSDQMDRIGDESGRFRLDFDDPFRRPTGQITINGQSYRRDQVSTGGTNSSNLSQSRTPSTREAGRRTDGVTAARQSLSDPAARSPFSANVGRTEDSGGSATRGGSLRIDRSAHPLPDALSGRVRSEADGPAITGPGLPVGQTRPPGIGDRKRPLSQPADPSSDATDGKANSADASQSEGSSFAQFAQNSRMTSPGATQPADSPAALDLSLRGTRRTRTGADGGQPSWGRRARAGAIGFEREVIVRITAEQVSVADETAFPITDGVSSDELRRRFLLHLEHHIQGWGEPPRSFYWLPSVKFVVSPGGNQYHQRLKAVAEQWDLRSTVKHVLE